MIRIGLGFNENDDDQFQAAAILKGLGRHKASYLTSLILADSQKQENNASNQNFDLDTIREVIREEIRNAGISSLKAPKSSKNKAIDEELSENQAEINTNSSDENIDDLLDGLASFK